MSKEENSKRIVCSNNDNLVVYQTAEEAVSDKFMEKHEEDMNNLAMHKKRYKLKRELKLMKDQKKKKYTPIVIEVISEGSHKGIPFEIVKEGESHYKATSPFFKKGCSAMPRKSELAAINQAHYLIFCIYNYDDIREEMLNEEGIEFMNNTDIVYEAPWEVLKD